VQRFKDRIAVVTGGSKGLGLAIANRLAEEGATVIAVSASRSAIDAASTIGAGFIGLQCDISNPEQLDLLQQEVRDTYGRVDLLVNNAGVAGIGPRLHEYPIEEWDRIIGVNIRGAFLTLRAFIPLMLDRGGAIVNMGSIGSIRPVANAGAYIVSKGAMVMLTRQAAIEYLSEGIRVNMVAPGPIMTPMIEAAGPDVLQARTESVPMKRLGTPDDVAAVTLFLLSDEARFTTGAIYTAAGGLEAF
jgi:NAD(P)-dependent dehydrogenase (short-subunit alcohol dehydrogenase family)